MPAMPASTLRDGPGDGRAGFVLFPAVAFVAVHFFFVFVSSRAARHTPGRPGFLVQN